MIKPRREIENIKLYPVDEYFEHYDLKLDSNENPLGASPKVIEAIKNIDSNYINHYPHYGVLCDEISKKYGFSKDNIVLTNGCDEAISSVMKTYLEQGDEVLSFSPTFSMPKTYANLCGAKFIEIEYPKKWEFDISYYTKNITKKTKVIYLTSPNSPTGEIISKEDVEFLCREYPDKLVVLDTTYSNYIKNSPDYFSMINDFQNLFILKSFSKDYALAGLRLGFIVSNIYNISNLKKVISPYTVNNLAVFAGIAALNDEQYFEQVKKEIKTSGEILYRGLKTLGYEPYCSEGNFILCDFGEKSNFIYNKLLINSIKVRRFSGNNNLKNCFRITIPNSADSRRILDTLKPRKMLIFDMDGVIFDVRNSYRKAIEKTVEHFSGDAPSEAEIQNAKNKGGLNCDWDLSRFLLMSRGYDIDLKQVIEVFQKYFYNPNNPDVGLINNEKLLIDKMILKRLAQNYDLSIFTGRPKDEALYSLQRFGLRQYFNIIVAKDDLPSDRQKPHSDGIKLIQSRSDSTEYYYLGDSVDDMICASNIGLRAYGVLPPQEQNAEYAKRLKDKGAYKILNNAAEIVRELQV